MKKIDLITETQRIRQLMNVQLINEQNLGKFFNNNKIMSRLDDYITGQAFARKVDFANLTDDQVERIFPELGGNLTNEAILRFLKDADELSAEQIKTLLKIDDYYIKQIILDGLMENQTLIDYVKALIAAEQRGDNVVQQKTKSVLEKYLDDSSLNQMKTDIKVKLDKEAAERAATQTAEEVARISLTQSQIDDIARRLERFEETTMERVYRNEDLLKRINRLNDDVKKLNKSAYKQLSDSIDFQIEQFESLIERVRPDLSFRIKKRYEAIVALFPKPMRQFAKVLAIAIIINSSLGAALLLFLQDNDISGKKLLIGTIGFVWNLIWGTKPPRELVEINDTKEKLINYLVNEYENLRPGDLKIVREGDIWVVTGDKGSLKFKFVSDGVYQIVQ